MEEKKIKGTGAEIINFLSMLKVVDFIGLFNVEWHSQNEFGNIGVLLLLRCHRAWGSAVRCKTRDRIEIITITAVLFD